MLGNRIKELRCKKGYTLSELAERAGVSKSYLSYIERDVQKNPSLQFLKKIANTLETSVEYLLGVGTAFDQKSADKVIDREWALLLQEAIDDGMKKEDLKEISTYFRIKKTLEG